MRARDDPQAYASQNGDEYHPRQAFPGTAGPGVAQGPYRYAAEAEGRGSAEGVEDAMNDYDDLLQEPDDEMFTCSIHDEIYRYRCPHCAVDEADRQLDDTRDRTLEIRAQWAARRRR